MNDSAEVLELRKISKSYGGITALEKVSLAIKRGEVHALVGENGAGKSTLAKIAMGLLKPNEGEFLTNGIILSPYNPIIAEKNGISMVSQEGQLVPELSVGENVLLGIERSKEIWSRKLLHARASGLLSRLGIDLQSNAKVAKLGLVEQRLVEIVRAIARGGRVILLDEPTASFSSSEVSTLFKIIKQLKQSNISFLYISHRMEEVLEIADRITVLRDGKLIGTEDVANVSVPDIVRMMIGDKARSFSPEKHNVIGKEVLRIEGLSKHGVFDDISFSVREGEILGITGLTGSGKTEIAMSIFGALKYNGGKIFLRGKEVVNSQIKSALKSHIAYSPEERKKYGLILPMTVEENINYPSEVGLVKKFWINLRRRREVAEIWKERLKIAANSTRVEVSQLSGGNQQKVVLAKCLNLNPDVVLLDEPTVGIDVGAKREIYRILRDVALERKALVLISSDIDEVLELADTILIVSKGRIIEKIERATASKQLILERVLGDRSH